MKAGSGGLASGSGGLASGHGGRAAFLGKRGLALLASLPGAAFQFLVLLGLIWAGTGWTLLVRILLGLLCAATLATAWQRRPYDAARLGFLLTHLGPTLVLLGLVVSRWVALAGLACLALGVPWMFYLKPRLRKKPDKVPAPVWQRFTLQGTRILFLACGVRLAVPVAQGTRPPAWALAAGIGLALALHLHHLKGWKGRRAQLAGLAAWALGGAAFWGLR